MSEQNEITSKLNPHMLKCLNYIQAEFILKKVEAKKLIFNKNRFDIILKYCVVEALENNFFIPFFNELFREQVRCITGGKNSEGDNTKNSYEDFLSNLISLIDSVKQTGFSDEISIIPVNKRGECIDGSHRIAVAAFFDEVVTTVELEHKHTFDQHFFVKNGMDQVYLDYAALKIIELNTNAYIINIHSIAEGKTEEAENLIEQYFDILYKKEVNLTKSGYHWLIRTCYKNEKWIGKSDNEFAGAYSHMCKSSSGSTPLRVYIIESNSLDDVLELKKYIRDLYDVGNYSVHITDTHEEAIDLAQLYFNKNSLALINNTSLLKKGYLKNVLNDLSLFKLWLNKKNIALSDICVDGSSVMGLYGLRETRDIDYIATDDVLNGDIDSPLYDNHEGYLSYHEANKTEILYAPDNYLYFENVKFISLSTLYKFKKNRDEIPKDLKDMELMNSVLQTDFEERQSNIKLNFRLNMSNIKLVPFLRKSLKKLLMPFFPEKSFQKFIAEKVLSMLRKTPNFVFDLNKLKHSLFFSLRGWISYSGYKLYYSKGTSIVERYLRTGSYEPEEQEFIKSYLNSLTGNKCMLDIGANIGMMSLNALESVKKLSIFAFEPGPHQHDLFKKTITKNGLEQCIKLFNIALNDDCGTANFAVHDTEDVSGDGFIDTGRAGKTKTITVVTQTLDLWWSENNKPNIDFVKMDVEGAELKVLKGGLKFFKEVQPVVLFEVHTENLRNYPYGIDDLMEFWSILGYSVRNINMSSIGQNQLDKMRGDTSFGIDLVAVSNNNGV